VCEGRFGELVGKGELTFNQCQLKVIKELEVRDGQNQICCGKVTFHLPHTEKTEGYTKQQKIILLFL
jgi:hypothetical protein